MRLRLRVRLSTPAPEPIFFGTAVVQPRTRCLPLAASLAAHLLFLFLAPAIAEHISWFDRDVVDLSAYKVEYIRLRVPDPLYWRASGAAPRLAKRKAAAGESRNVGRVTAPTPVRAAARRFEITLPFEVPASPRPSRVEAVLLQPEIQVEALPKAIPPIAFWARQAAPPPRPVKRLVLPGRTEDAAQAANLSAPPVLAASNREQVVADVNMGMALPRQAPALPVLPSATVPIRQRESVGEARSGPLDAAQGETANVIALSTEAIPASRVVEVLKGSNLNAVESGGGAAYGNRGGLRQAGEGESGGATGSTSVAPATRPVAGEQKIRTAAAGNGTASPLAVAATPEPAPPALPEAGVAVTRMKHQPGGLFDVVIQQSSGSGDIPETEGVLKGSPVYTVYLPVGGGKEWRMQFCRAPRAVTRTSVYQVNAEETGGVEPPYPISTVVPSSVLNQERPAYTVLHGILTAGGRLRSMAAMDPHNATVALIIPFLNQWEFRPATQDNRPVEVEILLAIPPRS
ncbi:MAG TPA: hypothetical protein VN442_05565 [Bryobacteraceae bacterium]|nr:hypothetical protein [Bryobacteraceae bacterium]